MLDKDDDGHSEEDVRENEDEDDQDDHENVLNEFVQSIDLFKEKVMLAYQSSSLKKGVKYKNHSHPGFNTITSETSTFSLGTI